jgi:hypothetical protein
MFGEEDHEGSAHDLYSFQWDNRSSRWTGEMSFILQLAERNQSRPSSRTRSG